MRQIFYGLCLAFQLVTACSHDAEVGPMVAEPVNLKKAVAGNVSVLVKGGSTTDFFGPPELPSENFRLAIEQSLKRIPVFSAGRSAPSYSLEAQILSIERQLPAPDTRVLLTVVWLLKDKEHKKLWRAKVVSKSTVAFADATWQSGRFELALEAATHANITDALKKLAAFQAP